MRICEGARAEVELVLSSAVIGARALVNALRVLKNGIAEQDIGASVRSMSTLSAANDVEEWAKRRD